MKKVIVSILAILYLGTSMGATIQLHYCMGKFVDWEIWHNNNSKCSKCGMDKKNNPSKGCCKYEHKWVKIQDDQKANYLPINLSHLQPAVTVSFLNNHADQFFTNTINLLPQSNAILRTGGIAIYKRNCVFKI